MSGNTSTGTLMTVGNGSDNTLVAAVLLFTPFLIPVLLIALVSNVILLTLIIKASKVNNNTNIYLFSIGILGLLGCFNTFTLLVTLIARKWVLGIGLCLFNDFVFRMTIPVIPLIHVVISRDRYKAVFYPLTYWQTKWKSALLVSVSLWAFAFVIGLIGTAWRAHVILNNRTDSLLGPECYYAIDNAYDTNQDLSRTLYVALRVTDALYFIGIGACSVVTLVYYFFIIRELQAIASLRTQYSMFSDTPILKVNGRDRPLQCSTEERTAKSLVVLFTFRFSCLAISGVLALAHITKGAIRLEQENPMHTHLEDIILLIFYLIPTIGPSLLILSNKRYRNRVRGLLKGEFRPENSSYTVYKEDIGFAHFQSLGKDGITNQQMRRSLFVSKASSYTAKIRHGSHRNNLTERLSVNDGIEVSLVESRSTLAEENKENNKSITDSEVQPLHDKVTDVELYLPSNKLQLPGQVL